MTLEAQAVSKTFPNLPRMTLNKRIAAYGVATFIGATLGLSLAAQWAVDARAHTGGSVYAHPAARLPACGAPEIVAYAVEGLRQTGADLAAVVDVAEDMRITAEQGHDVTAFCKAAAILDGGERKAVQYQIGWHDQPGGGVYVTGDAIR